jgi:hypothetical protein
VQTELHLVINSQICSTPSLSRKAMYQGTPDVILHYNYDISALWHCALL